METRTDGHKAKDGHMDGPTLRHRYPDTQTWTHIDRDLDSRQRYMCTGANTRTGTHMQLHAERYSFTHLLHKRSNDTGRHVWIELVCV